MTSLDAQIDQWRAFVERQGAITGSDVDEMEDHLRDQIADLEAHGLSDDEAFLVAVKRLGSVDALNREFATEHSERLWKQLVLSSPDAPTGTGGIPRDLIVALGCAVGAAAAVLIGLHTMAWSRFALNLAVLVGSFLTVYFGWKRTVSRRAGAAITTVMVAVAVLTNAYPYEVGGSTQILTILHAPIVVWFAVGSAYVAGQWRSHGRRMDFIRFTGEWVVYFTLLALGGGTLVVLTAGAFDGLGIDAATVIEEWVLPGAAAGAVIVAAWLVEAKQGVVENIAPVLTRVFTPLTIVMLLSVLAAFAVNHDVLDVSRDILTLVDLILVLVLGLVLYSISARDPMAPPDLFDRLQVVLLVAALAVDAVLSVTMLSRIADAGLTADKVAALGVNLVLLVNLVRSAWLTIGFVRGRRRFAELEGWQTVYLPVYSLWAAFVIIALPPLFGFA